MNREAFSLLPHSLIHSCLRDFSYFVRVAFLGAAKITQRCANMSQPSAAHEPMTTSEEPLSLEAFQLMLLDADENKLQLEPDEHWMHRCDSMLKMFEAASDECIAQLMKSTPGRTGNANWIGRAKHMAVSTKIERRNASPLCTWSGLIIGLEHSHLAGSMSLIERVFRVLMRTGCATSDVLNARGTSLLNNPLTYALCLGAVHPTGARLLLAQPNICVTLPRCRCVVDVNTGKLCNALVSTPSDPHTTLFYVANTRGDARTIELVTRRFGADLIAEEYAYAEFGACNGNHEGPRDQKSSMTLRNPLFACEHSIHDDGFGCWLAQRLPSSRLNELFERARGVTTTPLYDAVTFGLYRTADALLSRAPDCDLHTQFQPNSMDHPTTIVDLASSNRFKFDGSLRFLFEDICTAARVFGPRYHASASTLVAQILSGGPLRIMPRELLRLVLQYSALPPQPDLPIQPSVPEAAAAAAAGDGLRAGNVNRSQRPERLKRRGNKALILRAEHTLHGFDASDPTEEDVLILGQVRQIVRTTRNSTNVIMRGKFQVPSEFDFIIENILSGTYVLRCPYTLRTQAGAIIDCVRTLDWTVTLSTRPQVELHAKTVKEMPFSLNVVEQLLLKDLERSLDSGNLGLPHGTRIRELMDTRLWYTPAGKETAKRIRKMFPRESAEFPESPEHPVPLDDTDLGPRADYDWPLPPIVPRRQIETGATNTTIDVAVGGKRKSLSRRLSRSFAPTRSPAAAAASSSAAGAGVVSDSGSDPDLALIGGAKRLKK